MRLRSNGLKLSCYINERVNFSRATVISLPEECDTIAEVMPKIQQMMQLDKELKYAAELYNPDGSKITSWKELETALERRAAARARDPGRADLPRHSLARNALRCRVHPNRTLHLGSG